MQDCRVVLEVEGPQEGEEELRVEQLELNGSSSAWDLNIGMPAEFNEVYGLFERGELFTVPESLAAAQQTLSQCSDEYMLVTADSAAFDHVCPLNFPGKFVREQSSSILLADA